MQPDTSKGIVLVSPRGNTHRIEKINPDGTVGAFKSFDAGGKPLPPPPTVGPITNINPEERARLTTTVPKGITGQMVTPPESPGANQLLQASKFQEPVISSVSAKVTAPYVPAVANKPPSNLPDKDWFDRMEEFRKNPVQIVPYVGDIPKIAQLVELGATAKELESGREVSQEKLLALKEYVEKSQETTSTGYKIADVVFGLIPFGLELLITKGVYSATKKAVVVGGEQALKRLATKTGAKVLEGKLAKFGLQAAGAVVGGTAQTIPAGATRIAASTLEKQLTATLTGDEESVWRSLVKATGEQWVETVSERSGGALKPLTDAAKGAMIKRGLLAAFLKANPGKNAADINKIIGQMGYNGILGEMFEERIADVAHGVLNQVGLSDQEFKLPSLEQLAVEVIAFSIPAAGVGALSRLEQMRPQRGAVGLGGALPPEGEPGKKESILGKGLTQDAEALLAKAETIDPQNPDVAAFKANLAEAKAATTPEAQRQALLKNEGKLGEVGLEEKVRAIAEGMGKGKPVTPASGEAIAKELGVTFNGVQEGIKDIPASLTFTDTQTGSTFLARNLEEARTKLTEMRAKFGAAETPTPTVTLYRGEPVGVRPREGNVPFTPDISVARGWAGGTGQVIQVTLPRTEFDKLQFQKLPDRIATYFLPQDIYSKATPIEPQIMAPSTSVQTGLPGMGKETAQAQFFGEVSGKTSQKQPLTQPPAKGIEPLPGQIAFETGMTPEEKRFMESQARKEFNATQEWTTKSFPYGTRITGRKTGIRNQVGTSIRFVDLVTEGNQLEFTTYRKAKAINPHVDYSKYNDKKNFPKFYDKVPLNDILDAYASEYGFADADAFREAIIQQYNDEKLTGKPRLPRPAKKASTFTEGGKPLTPEETALSNPEPDAILVKVGDTYYNEVQINALIGHFDNYIRDPSIANKTAIIRAIQARERGKKLIEFNMRSEELQAEGKSFLEAEKQALDETMRGKLTTDEAVQDFTDDMAGALFAKVKLFFRDKTRPIDIAERISTEDALTNFLAKGYIPEKPGTGTEAFPEGGSARLRLERVFGGVQEKPVTKITEAPGQPIIPQEPLSDIITSLEKQRKPLRDIVDGIIREKETEPAIFDAGLSDYLRNLGTKPFGQARLGETPFTPSSVTDTRTETEQLLAKMKLQRGIEKAEGRLPPSVPLNLVSQVDNAFKQDPLLNINEKKLILEILTQLKWAPADFGNGIRAILSSFDFSAFRTGHKLAASSPVDMYNLVLDAFTSTFSQKFSDASWAIVTRDPVMEMYEAIRLKRGFDPIRAPHNIKGISRNRLAEEFGFNNRERLLQKMFSKIPWMKHSNRGFVTPLNNLIWKRWKTEYRWAVQRGLDIASGKVKLKEGQAWDIEKHMTGFQEYLGDMVQRASLGRFEQAAPVISGVGFAPKARLANLIVGRHLFNFKNPRVMRNSWQNIGAWIAQISAIILLGELLGLWEVEKDPKSGQAWTVRIGRIRIDLWEGQRAVVTLYSRLLTGTTRSAITGKERAADAFDTAADFIRSSFAPIAQFITDWKTGKTMTGEKFDLADIEQDLGRVVPMAAYQIWKTFRENWQLGLATSPLALLGENINVYDTPEVKVPSDIAKLGGIDTVGQDEALKTAVKAGASSSKIKEIQNGDWLYDIQSLRRDINENTSPDRIEGLPPIVKEYWTFAAEKKSYDAMSDKEQEAYLKNNPDFVNSRIFWGEQVELPDLKTTQAVSAMADKYNIPLNLIPAFQPYEKTFKIGGKEVKREVERVPSDKATWPKYFDYQNLPDTTSTAKRDVFLRDNPAVEAHLLLNTDKSTINSLKAAEQLEAAARQKGIPLNQIKAFSLVDEGENIGKQRFPEDKKLWPVYFGFNDLPGSSYLAMSKAQVEAGLLPDKYLKDWQTYQKLKTDFTRDAFRKGHKEAAKGDWRDNFRRANREFDKWLQENKGMKPLPPITPHKLATRKFSPRTASVPSFGGISSGGGTARKQVVFKKPRVSGGMSIRAPGAPRA